MREDFYIVTFTFKDTDIGKRVKVAGSTPASAIRVATYELTRQQEDALIKAEVKSG